VIHVIIFAVIAAGAALIASVAFVVVVLGIHATERRYQLRQPGYGRIDAFTRRLLGVYAEHPRRETKSAEYDHNEEVTR
jgi:hypothetical protein